MGMESNLVFEAVSSPTRRRILDLLRVRERVAGDFVQEFSSLPQPAVSRHLRVLREAGLVTVCPRGQRRIYALRPGNLRELDEWVSTYRRFWSDQLDALERHLDQKRGRTTESKE
jgi:DNA-binding transcriptional ArsR family regulator